MTKKSLEHFKKKNDIMPFIAILRGISADEAVAVSDALVEAGITIIEVTLNSPSPYESIRLIHKRHAGKIALGAGTVLTREQVSKVKQAGGELIISPNFDSKVVMETCHQGLVAIPGCYTPSEIFSALNTGADMVKIFPADTLGSKYIAAIKAVLPQETMLCPTGGMNTETIPKFLKLGISSIGLGSVLYKAGKSLEKIKQSAELFVEIFRG